MHIAVSLLLIHGLLLVIAVSNKFIHRREDCFKYKSAEQAGVDFATELVGPEPGQLERLRQLPAKQLAEAYANKRATEQLWQGFYPCIDPSDDVIPASPYEVFRQGQQARVPIMVRSDIDSHFMAVFRVMV